MVLVLLAAAPALAATPPALVNYQGVLRDASDRPLTGTYDMLFRFMDDATAGNEIMTDQHASVTLNAVTVSGGLFNVALGSGTLTDGSGSGTYASLESVFRDYGAVWVEVNVGGEALSPRTQIRSAAYALNAANLGGEPAGNFIDTSSTQQAKNGRLNVVNGNAYDYALVARAIGTGGTGVFASGGDTGVSAVGAIDGVYGTSSQTGVYGYGDHIGVQGSTGAFNAYGGWFTNYNPDFGYGLYARGPTAAGHFESSTSPGVTADLATSNAGISGSSPNYGGVGVYGFGGTDGVWGQSNDTGGKFFGAGPGSGIAAFGPVGGRFYSDGAPGSSVEIASPAFGVNASWSGSYAGYFQATGAGSTGVYASGSSTGVSGAGSSYGGSFTGNGSSSVGVYGSSSGTGVSGHGGGVSGGYFDNVYSGYAYIAYGDSGLVASGNLQGGKFTQGSASGAYAQLAYNRTGVAGYARNAGENPGWFQDLSSSSYASIGQAGYKIVGSGAVSFVQNDPEDPSSVIVYAAPEGDEVAVYTRGSARLVNGEARVPLGPTFRKVANPDLGLTANVTPIGDAIPLAVAEKSTSELVVRGPAGSTAGFDYVVWGLRIGFEDRAVVQPKERESFIPSRDADDAIYQRRPELREYSARQRYLAELAQRDPAAAAVAMDKSLALEQAVGVYDRARDEARIAPLDPDRRAVAEKSADEITRLWKATTKAAPPAPAQATGVPVPAPAPIASPASVPAPAPAASPQLGVAIARVADNVEPGDVVVADPGGGDSLRLGARTADPLLAGIVVAPAPSTRLDPGEALVALAGSIVPCRVDATLGAIHAGDLLTSSPTPGYAMRATDAAPGTILAKALQDLDGGTGTIRVFVMAR